MIRKRSVLGTALLLQLHPSRFVRGFVAVVDRAPRCNALASALGSSRGGVDAMAVGSPPSLPAWYEGALLDSSEDDETIFSAYDEDQWDALYDEELQELCVIDGKAFDISQPDPDNRKRSMRRHPRRHKHLFRYSPDISVACWLSTATTEEVLQSCGFTQQEVERMAAEYPRLLNLDAKNMVAPKLRFLVNVLKGGSGDIGTGVVVSSDATTRGDEFAPHNLLVSRDVRERLPAKAFFDSRLETALGPRHAYLALHADTLPCGKELIQPDRFLLLGQFLEHCSKKPAEFAEMCNQWQANNVANRPNRGESAALLHTAETVSAMDNAFCDGVLPFAKNDITPDLEVLGCSPGRMLGLLLDHGANYAEHDDWGSTVLHWAAGTGNLAGVKAIVKKLEYDELEMEGDVSSVLWSACVSCFETKDQATPLHWASAGVDHTHFGSGGHVNVCKWLLNKAGSKKESLANSVTESGNTPLMWACWSGSLDVAKLLVKEGHANPFARSRDGFTCAHWAAASGSLDVCKFLKDVGLEFSGKGAENNDRKTPLDCAQSYEQTDVVSWIEQQNLSP